MVDTEKIVGEVMKTHKTGDLTGLITWLERLGCRDVKKNKTSATLTGLTGMRVGFTLGDPCTLAVCTGFALFGAFWVQVCSGILEKVNKKWKREVR